MPYQKRAVLATNGQTLDKELGNIKSNAENNYKEFKNHLRDKGSYLKKCKMPVFVTPAERIEFNSVEKQTKEDLISMIKELNPSLKIKTSSKKEELIATYMALENVAIDEAAVRVEEFQEAVPQEQENDM